MGLIAVTGPRRLTPEQELKARNGLVQLLTLDSQLHVGDAFGLDNLARGMAEQRGIATVFHKATGWQPWQLQQRSKRMVDAVALGNGTLHGWPNKPCPPDITVGSWRGSGTWGTIRYAVSRGVTVELHPLVNLELPDWLEPQRQMLIW